MSKCKAFRSGRFGKCFVTEVASLDSQKTTKHFKDQHKTASDLIVITSMRICNILEEATRLIIQKESS